MQVPFDIDYVFPWVNDGDPVWRNVYEAYCMKTQSYLRLEQFHNERYRDWGLLKYLFRAIETNMPWIRKVHLIVSNLEQVPRWLDMEKVHVVLHSSIIPAKFLPTFNSTAIEMFLDHIEGLAEHFIYGNDDIFPNAPTEPSDWYTQDGLPRYSMRELESKNIGNKQFPLVCASQWWTLEEKIFGKSNKRIFKRPVHGLSPMTKTLCVETKELITYSRIYKSISNFRQAYNMNQYIYLDYAELKELRVDPGYTFEYCGAKGFQLIDFLRNTKAHVICLNDCASGLNNKQIVQLQILTAHEFEIKYPNKSKYEIEGD